MALSGLDIYKLLPGGVKPPHPKANCKECGFPTCLAFAMKLAAKQAELSGCKYVSDEAKAKLSAAAAPPIRLITLSADGRKVEVGNEVVLFRHEKTFYHPAALLVRVPDTLSAGEIAALAKAVADYKVDYVGMALQLDGLAVEAVSGDAGKFAAAVAAARGACNLPLVLVTEDPAIMAAGLPKATGGVPLLCAATASNWEAMAKLAKDAKAPLVVRGATLGELAELTEKLAAAGVEDLVLDPTARSFNGSLVALTEIRRLALKKAFRQLGYPAITFPYLGAPDPAMEELLAGQQVAKYAGFVVLSGFDPSDRLPAARAARQPLHRSAEADPGGARRLPDQQAERRFAGAGHDQFLDHLLCGGERDGVERHAGLAVGGRRRGHECADRLGRRQIRRREDRQDGQEHRHRGEDQPPQGGHPRPRRRADGRAGRGAARLADQGGAARGGGSAAVFEDGVVGR